jgi:hypothetical protein
MPKHTSRFLLTAAVAAASFPASADAASMTVWESTGYRGQSTVIDSSIRSLSALGWNDRISSLRVDSGQWEVCRDTDFRGCRILAAEEIGSFDSTWNDAISSIRPVSTSSAESAEQTAQRLYRAVLGRDADAEGLRNAAEYVSRGQIAGLIRGLTQSNEYRSLRASRSAAELLDQMYRALLGRPADTTGRRAYLAAIERGEDAQVIADLLASDEYLTRSDGTPTDPDEEYTFTAEGAGLVVWGANGRYESLSGANVVLARDHQARIELTGTTPQTLTGTWTREEEDLVRLQIPDVGGRRLNASGTLLLDEGELAQFELIGGTPGARSSAVMTFAADSYELPRDEMLCRQEARAELEDERGSTVPMLFLAPERSRVSSSRDQLNGDALVLAERGRFTYNCEIDTRRGQVLTASVAER